MARVVAVMSLAIPLASSGIAGGAPGKPGAPGSPVHSGASGPTAPRDAPVKLEVLGIRIGMRETDAHRRLTPLGARGPVEPAESEVGEGGAVERELWTMRGTDFGFVGLGIDGERRVAAIQAFARPGRRSIRYRDIGSLGQAQKLGFFIYLWTVPGTNGTPGLRVEARGVDPEYLGSYSITRERARPGEPARRAEESAREGSE